MESPYAKVRKVLYLVIGLVTAYILYKSYQYLNVNNRVPEIVKYDKDLKWDKMPNCDYDEQFNDSIVADFFYCSSSNTPFVSNLKFDYLDLEIIKKTLLAGVRYIEFTVIENDLTDNPTPVVSRKIEDGELQSTINNLMFDEVCYTVKKYAFQSYYNNKDKLSENRYPLFVYLNITSTNIDFLNNIANTIKNIWGNRLLDNKYSYMYNDLAHVKICELFGKIVIITDNDTDIYMGSQYDNLVNYNKLKRLHYSELFTYNILEEAKIKGYTIPSHEDIIDNPNELVFKKLDIPPEQLGKHVLETPDHLVEFTKQNLIVIYPNNPNDITMTNHDFRMAITFGCQFISMNYQVYDDNMKEYIKIFEKKPLILKSRGLRLTRDKLKKTIIPKELTNKIELNIISKPELMFNGIAIAILPYMESTSYAKHNPNTRKIVTGKLPKATPNDPFNVNGFSEEDLYMVKPSLSNIKNAICFKSVKYPNRYLVNSTGIIQLLPDDKSDIFYNNSSFYLIDAGNEDSTDYFQIVSAIETDHYLRVVEDDFRLDKYKGERTFGDEVKFGFKEAKISKYTSFQDYKGRYLRILDGGFLTCNIKMIDTSAKFKLYKLLHNNYSILASNNNFLEYDNINTVTATSSEMKPNVTKFQIIQHGTELNQIITYSDPNQKTIYPTEKGGITLMYDGNILSDKKQMGKLGYQKYFKIKYSYGIEQKEKQIY